MLFFRVTGSAVGVERIFSASGGRRTGQSEPQASIRTLMLLKLARIATTTDILGNK